MTIEIGAEAPDFTLSDTDKSEVTLSSYRGRKSVTLVFIPFAFTGVCEGELCTLRDNISAFDTADNQVIAITCDRQPSLAEWKKQQGFGFPLLSDGWPHGGVSKAYGVFNEDLGCAERVTFTIDMDGKVVDTFATGSLGVGRTMENFSESLSKL
jgi:peroxiredoxin (alkyl hydroperoxide reductase subunit C)